VTDSQGLTGQASVTLIVESQPPNYPPVPSIYVASTGSAPIYDWNSTFTFNASATDVENNTPFVYHLSLTALSEAGAVQGVPLDLGSAATTTWTPVNSYSFFFGSGACQTTAGQRVRVTLTATDSASQTGTYSTEVRVSCPPG
jgi:hypothetical protein